MAKRPLPVPRTSRPLPKIEVATHREPLITLLAEIHHAEKAALDRFVALGDPTVVEHSEIFVKARALLLRDEAAHMEDLEDLLRDLGADRVPPPSAASAELAKRHEGWKGFALPMRPSLPALYLLYTEGLGYCFLHHLAHAVDDEQMRETLMTNVRDEEGHLHVSMQVLRNAIKLEGRLGLSALALQGTLMLAELQSAARDQRALLEALGLDYFVVAGSGMRFVRDLLVGVAEEAGMELTPWQRRQLDAWATALCSPGSMRVLHATSWLPEPRWLGTAASSLSKLDRLLHPDV